MEYKKVLTIAGSDSGGGAGIQADLKTFSALGCYGMSVITALTAQNTVEVKSIYPIPVSMVISQIDAVIEDIGVDAVKIGMLHDKDIIMSVADRLKYYRVNNIVLDPVMVAKSGDTLLKEEAIMGLKKYLFSIADIITPNLPEAAMILDYSVNDIVESDIKDMKKICKKLSELGPKSVLLKGGHLKKDKAIDILYEKTNDLFSIFKEEKINTKNSHGTGCTLSSAIASYLAKGKTISEAISLSKNYITQAIKSGASYKLGHGHGPVMHFYNFWN